MAESTRVRNKRDGVIAYSDSGASNTYTVAYEVGDFSFDVPGYGIDLYLDRGDINGGGGSVPTVRKADESPMTFSHTVHHRDIGDTAGTGGYATMADICHPYASGVVEVDWTGTLSNTDVLLFDAAFTLDGTAFGESDKQLTFPYSAVRGSLSEGQPTTYSVSGTSYAVRPTLS
jgi:hypothetical protein